MNMKLSKVRLVEGNSKYSYKLSNTTRRYITFFLLVAPALLLRISTSVYPVLQTIYLSFFEVNLVSQTNLYVGLQNFIRLARDISIRDITSFTIMFTLLSTLLELIFGMIIANFLNTNFTGRQLARTINLIPWAIPTIVAALAFRWMFDDQYGLIVDWIYRLFGIRPALLVFPLTSQLSVILVNVWKNTPFTAIVLLAGLQNVPPELYEAARIDGANSLQAFRWITIPVSVPIIITLILFHIIWQLSGFDLIYGMTSGGPGIATTLIGYRIFQKGMLWYDWGTASALGVVLILIVAIIGIIGLYLFKKYEVTL